MNESQPDFHQRFRTLAIVCAAIAMGVVLVNLVLVFLHVSGSLPASGMSGDVALAFLVVSLLLLLAGPAAKRAIFKRFQAEEGFENGLEPRLNAYVRGTIVSFALREAASLLGFVLALLTGNPWWSWGLGGAALIAMYVDRPRLEDLGAPAGR